MSDPQQPAAGWYLPVTDPETGEEHLELLAPDDPLVRLFEDLKRQRRPHAGRQGLSRRERRRRR